MRALAVVVFLALVAGCLGGASPELKPAAVTEGTNESTLKLEKMADAPLAKEATLDAAPAWVGGEWWKVKVSDGFDGKSYEGTRVVAGKEGLNYLVGMPRDGFVNALMVLHLPGFGQISQQNLSYAVHNCEFKPLQFPLKDGAEWDTQFECQAIHAKAAVKSPTLAEVTLTNANGFHMVVTYDAAMHEISKLVYDGYATMEVTGHGYGYNGIVTVPHMFTLVFQQSRVGVLLAGNKPGAPTETVKVDPTYDRVSFVLIAGSLLPLVQPGAPDQSTGYYQETATGPDSTTYEVKSLPGDSGLKMGFFMAEHPGGDWKFQHVAAGPGLTLAEGIAYHVYDVQMPEGKVLPSTGAHHHGG